MGTLTTATVLSFLVLAQGPRVRVQWERSTDFSKYQTYSWIEGTRAIDDEADRIIVQAVDDKLGVAGIFLDEVEPDLYVVYYAARDESFEITGGYRLDWKDTEAVTANAHVAGTLVIDLVDVEENQLVWRATATASISQDRNKDRKTIDAALDKMFANFPPASR